MAKSATDVMHDIIFAAVIDGVMALRTSSGGLPNTLLRDLNAIHANTTFADLPREVQAAITGGVRAAFTRLLREGYTVTSATAPPPPPPRSQVPRREPGGRPPQGRPPQERSQGERRRGGAGPGGPGGKSPGGKPPRRGGPPKPR